MAPNAVDRAYAAVSRRVFAALAAALPLPPRPEPAEPDEIDRLFTGGH